MSLTSQVWHRTRFAGLNHDFNCTPHSLSPTDIEYSPVDAKMSGRKFVLHRDEVASQETEALAT
jgi:hypothetical protein